MTRLLIYDWACGQLVSLEDAGDEPEAALAAAEWVYADDPSIEVRLVEPASAPSAAPSR